MKQEIIIDLKVTADYKFTATVEGSGAPSVSFVQYKLQAEIVAQGAQCRLEVIFQAPCGTKVELKILNFKNRFRICKP